MTSETIYDWPSSVIPRRSLFTSGGAVEDGGFSASGAQHFSPAPGGVSYLKMEFAGIGAAGLKHVSWLMSMISRRALFRVPVRSKAQSASHAALGLAAPDCGAAGHGGILWDNGQPWDNGQGWDSAPLAEAAAAALEGSVDLTLRMGGLLPSLSIGDVIGYGGFAHVIEAIDYSGAAPNVTAAIRLFTPLRRALAASDILTLRPAMTGRVEDPLPFLSMFQYGKWAQPGSITFREAML